MPTSFVKALWIHFRFLLCILTIIVCAACSPKDAHKEPVDSTALLHTTITATLDEPIVPGKNVVFCATFQLAWNELLDLIGEEVKLDGEPPLADALNKRPLTKDILTEDCYVAMAGIANEGILDKVNAALQQKFGPEAPTVVEQFTTPRDIFSYAFMNKDVLFELPFEKLKKPIIFGTGDNKTNIAAFGLNDSSSSTGQGREIAKQVSVYSTTLQDDVKKEFNYVQAIKIKTKDPMDELVLASIPPQTTVLDTFRLVDEIIEKEESDKEFHELFGPISIPLVDMNIVHSYVELIEKNIQNEGKYNGYTIIKAFQSIQFKLDERGASLKSEARVLAKAAAPPVFNGPFLLWLRQKGQELPYLAIWVDNPEILVRK